MWMASWILSDNKALGIPDSRLGLEDSKSRPIKTTLWCQDPPVKLRIGQLSQFSFINLFPSIWSISEWFALPQAHFVLNNAKPDFLYIFMMNTQFFARADAMQWTHGCQAYWDWDCRLQSGWYLPWGNLYKWRVKECRCLLKCQFYPWTQDHLPLDCQSHPSQTDWWLLSLVPIFQDPSAVQVQ